jgi:hypothetical protein
MYTMILFGIIGAIVPWVFFREEKISEFDVEDWGLSIFLTIAMSVIGVLAGLMIATALPQESVKHTSKLKIHCLNDNQSVKYLGRFKTDGTMKYAFYSTDSEGFYKLNLVDYDRAKIRLIDGEPSVEITTTEFVNSWGIDGPESDRYIFNVPKGTIDNSFTLDAK